MVEPSLADQGVDGSAVVPDAWLRLPLHVPDRPDLARLVTRAVRRELHVLAGERPGARERRHQQRPAPSDLGDELRPVLQPASGRHVLLERRPGGLRGQQGHAVAHLDVLLVVAVGDDACGDRPDDGARDVRPAVLVACRSPGAAKYEVEVNSSVDFAPGSKVCCSQLTISTSLAPTVVFRDNTYYWRVRALDAAGNAGVWNRGPDFVKTFDKVPPVTAPSIKNLHMRDNLADPGTDVDRGHGRLPDERPGPRMGHRPRRLGLPRGHRAVQRQHLRVGQHRRLAGDDLRPVVDAHGLGLERRQAVSGPDERVLRLAAARAQSAVLRARPSQGRARHAAPGRLRRLHVSRRRHRRGLPVDGLPRRGRVHAFVQRRLSGHGRLPASGARHAHPADAAHHVEAARRAPELLRPRLEGRELQQHRRLRLHADSGLLPAQPLPADDVLGRDDALLLGASAGVGPERKRRRRRSALGRSVELPEAVDPAVDHVAGGRRDPRRSSPSSAGRPSRAPAATASRSPRSRPSPRRSKT